jgi:hypothetical protein
MSPDPSRFHGILHRLDEFMENIHHLLGFGVEKKHPLIRAIKDTTNIINTRKIKHTTNQRKEMLHSPEFLFSSAPSATPQKSTPHNHHSKNPQVQLKSHESAISMATTFDPNSTLWGEWFNLEVGGRVS